MKLIERGLHVEDVRRLFRLHVKEGALYWVEQTHPRINLNKPAGSLNNKGYYHIVINQKKYLRSRLIFAYVNGFFPKEVDHENRIRHDDRPFNLRESNRSHNALNSVTKNSTGFKHIISGKKRAKNGKIYYSWIIKIHKKVNGKIITIYEKSFSKNKYTLEQVVKIRDDWLRKNDIHRFECRNLIEKKITQCAIY